MKSKSLVRLQAKAIQVRYHQALLARRAGLLTVGAGVLSKESTYELLHSSKSALRRPSSAPP